jgi:hypothetical protein
MSTRKPTVLLLLVGVAWGCAAGEARFRALQTGQTDFDTVWQATVETLQQEFDTVQADRANRIITTQFKTERPDLGLLTIPATVVTAGQVANTRRRATASVVQRGGQYVVLLRVEKQQEETEAATAATYNRYDPTDTSHLESFQATPGELKPMWMDAGSDDQLRDKLLERIAQKLKAKG